MINKIFHADCIDFMDKIPNNSIDMVLCDLPYGTTNCSWDIIIPFEKLWKAYYRICKENAAIVLFAGEPFASYLRLSNIKDYRYDWYWNKKRAANFLFMNKMPGKIVENICVFYRKLPTYNPQKILNPNGPSTRHLHKNPSKITKNVKDIMGESWSESEMNDKQNYHGKNYEPDKLLPNNILTFTKPTKRIHPTEKPVELLEYLIKTYTNENQVILDNCSGSGATAIACLNTKRNFICIEKNEEYYVKSIERVNNASKE